MPQPTPLSAVGDVANAIRQAPRVAVDTEFHAERRYHPHLYLLQVGLPDGTVFLLDPEIEGVIEGVVDALRETPWIVHAGRQDLRILAPILGGLPDSILDTQIAAGLLAPRFPASYASLVETWLGRSLDKASTLSDWSRRPLRPEQLQYAADDARLLPELWATLAAALGERGRLELAEAACADARAEAITPADPDDAWRDLAARQVVDGPGLAVLQELCAWREALALEEGTPARSVLSDGLVVDLARRRPTTVNRLLSNRRFPRRVAKRLGDELIERVQRAAARPEWGWPRVVRPQSDEERALHFLQLALETAGARDGWSRRLVAPDLLLEDILLHDLPRDVSPVERLAPWQRALAGDALEAAVSGSASVNLEKLRPTLSFSS